MRYLPVFSLVVLFTTSATIAADEPAADLVPPDCLWTDDFGSPAKAFCVDGVSISDGKATLEHTRRESVVPITDPQRVKRLDGWGAGPRCSKAGAKLVFEFSGCELFAVCSRPADGGIIEVRIDGKQVGEVDLYGTGGINCQRMSLAKGLKNGPHVAEIIVTGKKSDKSTGTVAVIHLLGSRWEGYPASGYVTSVPIICSAARNFRWGKLNFGTTQPAGTSVKVDVLDAQDKVILSDVPEGADLAGVKASAVKLRATLTTNNCEVTPSLEFWNVSYTTDQKAQGKLSGCVGSAVDGRGIGGVEVVAITAGAPKASTTTGTDGHYRFDNLSAGTYNVRIAKDGFLAAELKQVQAPSNSLRNVLLYRTSDVDGKRLTLWTANAMRNIFKEDRPPKDKATKDVRIEAARNEYEPAQIALTAHEPLSGVSVEVGDLKRTDGGNVIEAENIETNFVGYVSVWKNSPAVPDDELAAKAPRDFPDPLLLDETIDIPTGCTQPVWITVKVPKDAKPGDYTADVNVRTAYGTSKMKLHLHVWPFALSDETHIWNGHVGSGWSRLRARYQTKSDEEHWNLVKMCLKEMIAHRENVIHTDESVFGCTKIVWTSDGKWRYDFSRLDRWVETVLSCYGDRRVIVQFTCFAGRKGWLAGEIHFNGCTVYNEDGSKCAEKSVKWGTSTDSAEFKQLAKPFFAALQKHLEEKGWLGIVRTLLQDEPLDVSRDTYKKLAATVHEAAPKLRRAEHILTTDLADYLEVQIPLLSCFDKDKDYYLTSHKRGRDVWFYTCWQPRGRYPCRLIDYPLIKHRIIQWMTYKYQVGGFARWGWACWHKGEPYEETGTLAPGDSYVVYPDPQKKRIISSLRWEMMRESVEDYEYLWILAEATRKVAKQLGGQEGESDPIAPAMALCARAVQSCTDYERDPDKLLALRRQIAEAIIEMGSRPPASAED